jgi:hypothetical protein
MGSTIWGAGTRRLRRRKAIGTVAIGVGAALALAAWQLQRMWTQGPRYELERRLGRVEIRRYAPRVVAETEVQASGFEQALNEGFRRLAGYIFGGNERAQKIAMTSPVTSSPEAGGRTVVFGMPNDRGLGSLPRPKDSRIRLRDEPARRVAALRYHGRYRGAIAEAKAAELLAALRAGGLQPIGRVSFAGYDPPWRLPLLRRVEAWVEIA